MGFVLALLLGSVLVGGLWLWAFAQGLAGQSEVLIPGLIDVRDNGRTVSSSIQAGALVIPLVLAIVGAFVGALIGRRQAIGRRPRSA